jgi:hypothetical protein
LLGATNQSGMIRRCLERFRAAFLLPALGGQFYYIFLIHDLPDGAGGGAYNTGRGRNDDGDFKI